jgi:Fur family ferric uptake transcriptional regulator
MASTGVHHSHSRESLSELTHRLRGNARRITGPRQAILDHLRGQKHPVTIKEIHELLPEGNCDLATIYRSMHLLEELKLVERFDFGDGVARFEMKSADEGLHHHHHLVCKKCSQVVEIDECFPSDLQDGIASRNGFKEVTHKLEFFGTCPDCQ